MEKQAKAKTNIFKWLPATGVAFQNPLFSPNREKRSIDSMNKLKSHVGRGFSGPMVSIIPAEARRKSKNDQSFETREPTSPKISCMGQIKHKQKNKNSNTSTKKMDKAKTFSHAKDDIKPANRVFSPSGMKKQAANMRRIFTGSSKPARKLSADLDETGSLPDRAPTLSQTKKFASSRDTLANFDWTAHQIAPEESDQEQEQEDEVIIPFSAPMTVGGGIALRERKEVNLWKRRTINPPAPLQLKS